jgi:hypothetical protein
MAGERRWPGQPSVRVVCNRDERRSRPQAEPARIHDIGGVRAVYPVDPPSRGTWIAANEHGLVFSLLNRNVGPATASQLASSSRGGIILRLLKYDSIEEIADHADRLADAGYAPFRLVVVGSFVWELTWDGEMLAKSWHELSQPLLITSSGLGDERVEGPRRRLFEAMMRQGDRGRGWQDDFHQHQWPGREEISVRMERADARTVSITAVERLETEIVLRDDAAGQIHLPLKQLVRS